MSLDANDYTVAQISAAAEEVVTCYCYLKGDDAIDTDSALKSLCTDYLDAEKAAVTMSVFGGLLLAVLNLIYKYGFYAFRNCYRFASVRTQNLVL